MWPVAGAAVPTTSSLSQREGLPALAQPVPQVAGLGEVERCRHLQLAQLLRPRPPPGAGGLVLLARTRRVISPGPAAAALRGLGRRCRCHTRFMKANRMHLICVPGSVYTHMIDHKVNITTSASVKEY